MPKLGINPNKIREALIQEALFYAGQNDWLAAGWYYQSAIEKMADQLPVSDLAEVHNLTAVCLIKQAKGEEALHHLHTSLALLNESDPSSALLGPIYNNLGAAHNLMGAWQEPHIWLCRAVDWAMEPDHDDAILPYTHAHLAKVFRMLGERDHAIDHGEQSLAACLKHKNTTRTREALTELIELHREAGNLIRVNQLIKLQQPVPN